jgi:hypothetical protein
MGEGALEHKFNVFYNAVKTNDVLEPKTTLLLQLAMSMAVGCYP